MSLFQNRAMALSIAASLSAGPAVSETDQGAHIALDLNAVQQTGEACKLSFVVQNGHASDIAQATYEAVLFDSEGRVDRLTLFDFGALPSARPRVRQFVVPDLDCASLGRLLINGSETCTGEGLAPDACTKDLELRSRSGVEVLG